MACRTKDEELVKEEGERQRGKRGALMMLAVRGREVGGGTRAVSGWSEKEGQG